jgi:hypothetical protein
MKADPLPTASAPAREKLALGQQAGEILWYWGVVAAWMLVISYLSSDAFSASNTNRYIDPVLRLLFPGISVSGIFLAHTVIRKTAHFAEFFVLGLLVFWAARRGREARWRKGWMLLALAVACGYALLDELRQALVPTRTASLADSGVDSLGALASQLTVFVRARWHSENSIDVDGVAR